MKLNFGKLIIPLVIALLCSFAAMLISLTPFFETLEHKTIDLRIQYRNPDRSFGEKVAVILIDEPVMERFSCRVPVSRKILADLIKIMDASGAGFIGLDVFLKNRTTQWEDDVLVNAMQTSRHVVLISAMREEAGDTRLDLPHKIFMDAALATGLADLPVNPIDQRVRQAQPFYSIGGKKVPSFSTTLFLLDQKKDSSKVNHIPLKALDSRNRFFIDYQGPSSTSGEGKNVIRALPASAVLTGLVPKEWFKDKIVLIGAGYEDNTDTYRTPFYSSRFSYVLMPGVEIHANALATLLSEKSIENVPPKVSLFIIILFCVFLLMVEKRFNTFLTSVAMLIFWIGYMVLSFIIFEKTGTALPIVPYITGLSLTFILLTIHRSLTEGRQRRWIKNAFQMYISPEFVNILTKEPDLLLLGGTEKELTILFSDLQGFTSLSEGMEPVDLVALLNEYLDGMTKIVLAHGGTLDKYEGDAVMAFWGAPVEQQDHACKAVAAALEMSVFSDSMNKRYQQQGKPEIKTRIGINSGKVIVGNIGSEKRFNYTIIGDEVNLASRLESANKQYGTFLMVSESTYLMVKGRIISRQLDTLRVKGKEKPVKVYEVTGDINLPAGEEVEKFLEIYNEAFSAYQKRKWKKAGDLFNKVIALRPNDGPALTYLDRCRYFMKNPPDAGWDGVFRMKTK